MHNRSPAEKSSGCQYTAPAATDGEDLNAWKRHFADTSCKKRDRDSSLRPVERISL